MSCSYRHISAMKTKTNMGLSRGTHSSDHLSSLIADHYKQEDVDFHLWNEGER